MSLQCTIPLLVFLLTFVEGKSLFPYYHQPLPKNFQDLVPDSRVFRTGKAPTMLVKSKTSNLLWGYENSLKEIHCVVEASPVASFAWKFRGMLITPEMVNNSSINISVIDNHSTLKVKVEESSLGEYTCRAENELGAAETNVFLGRASKPSIPLFNTTVVPDSGILVKVIGFQTQRNLHVLQIPDFMDRREVSGEILPVKGYMIQIRIMRTCDNWRNISSYSEKHFLRSHLIPGTTYRMRMATITDAGVGEYSRAITVYYRLSDEVDEEDVLEDSSESSANSSLESQEDIFRTFEINEYEELQRSSSSES